MSSFPGDALHFGLACEKTNAKGGAPCGVVQVARRGLELKVDAGLFIPQI